MNLLHDALSGFLNATSKNAWHVASAVVLFIILQARGEFHLLVRANRKTEADEVVLGTWAAVHLRHSHSLLRGRARKSARASVYCERASSFKITTLSTQRDAARERQPAYCTQRPSVRHVTFCSHSTFRNFARQRHWAFLYIFASWHPHPRRWRNVPLTDDAPSCWSVNVAMTTVRKRLRQTGKLLNLYLVPGTSNDLEVDYKVIDECKTCSLRGNKHPLYYVV